jgi:hypothetical protein
MSIRTIEGVVEDGKIRLPADVCLPEKARVYVIIPSAVIPQPASIASPRLVKPEQAKDFKMEVIEGTPNASV